MQLDFSKDDQLQTRRGNPVRIYATDGEGAYPVQGAEFINGAWKLLTWTPSGSYLETNVDQPRDLIPKPRTVRVRCWLNVYADVTPTVHKTRDLADSWASAARIACIEIDREVTEGEGL